MNILALENKINYLISKEEYLSISDVAFNIIDEVKYKDLTEKNIIDIIHLNTKKDIDIKKIKIKEKKNGTYLILASLIDTTQKRKGVSK